MCTTSGAIRWLSIMVSNQMVDQVRRFERRYDSYLRKTLKFVSNEDFSVADVRAVHELSFAEGGGSGAWLAGQLELDEGYLCRILKKLEGHLLVRSRASESDGRMKEWELTKYGREFATSVENDFRERVRLGLYALLPDERRQLVDALRVVEPLLRWIGR